MVLSSTSESRKSHATQRVALPVAVDDVSLKNTTICEPGCSGSLLVNSSTSVVSSPKHWHCAVAVLPRNRASSVTEARARRARMESPSLYNSARATAHPAARATCWYRPEGASVSVICQWCLSDKEETNVSRRDDYAAVQ